MNRPAATHALTCAAMAVLLWPLVELAGARLGVRHPAVQVVWLRYAVHLVLLTAYCAWRRRMHALATRRLRLQLLRGGCMFSMPLCFLLARQHGAPPWVWSVFWLSPLLVLLVAPLLRERPRPAHYIAAAAAWLGAVAILEPHDATVSSTIFALGMAASFAGYLLASRALAGEPMAANLFYTGVGALVPMTLLALRNWTPLAPADLLPAVELGTASLGFLFVLDSALESAPATLIAPIMVTVAAWESVLRQDVPHGLTLLGMIVIGAAMLALLRVAGRERIPA